MAQVTRTSKTQQFQTKLQNVIKQELARAAVELRDLDKTTCPVRTGELRDSFEADLSNINQLESAVTSDSDHFLPVEYGSVVAPARPFATPNFNAVSDELTKDLVAGGRNIKV